MLLPGTQMLEQLERQYMFYPVPFEAHAYTAALDGAESVMFTAEDGARLHGAYFPAHPRHGGSRGALLYSHGNAGNLSHWASTARDMTFRFPYDVFLYDYRGYGRSEGFPTAARIVVDGRAARAWLSERRGLPPSSIVLLGRSLGGGVATQLAAEEGALGLIVQNSFDSLVSLAGLLLPWIPAGNLLSHRMDSVAAIRRFKGPFLQSHSTNDELIPLAYARRLFEAANEPKTFVTEQGGHNAPPSEAYMAKLQAFLSALPTV